MAEPMRRERPAPSDAKPINIVGGERIQTKHVPEPPSDTESVEESESYSYSYSNSSSSDESDDFRRRFNDMTEMLKNYPFFRTVYEVCDRCK